MRLLKNNSRLANPSFQMSVCLLPSVIYLSHPSDGTRWFTSLSGLRRWGSTQRGVQLDFPGDKWEEDVGVSSSFMAVSHTNFLCVAWYVCTCHYYIWAGIRSDLYTLTSLVVQMPENPIVSLAPLVPQSLPREVCWFTFITLLSQCVHIYRYSNTMVQLSGTSPIIQGFP